MRRSVLALGAPQIILSGILSGVFTATEVANDGVYSVTVTGWTPTFAADGTTVYAVVDDNGCSSAPQAVTLAWIAPPTSYFHR